MKKTRKIFRTIEFTIPIYGGKVIIISFLDNWGKVMSYLKRREFKTEEFENWEGVLGLQFSQYVSGSKQFVIIIKDNKAIGDTLVHELFHLTQDILEDRGINFIKEDNNEAYAYLIGYLFNKSESLLK